MDKIMSSCGQSAGGYPSDCEVLEGYRSMARNRLNMSDNEMLKPVLAKAKDVRLLLLDVDGVLTDGSLNYTNNGDEIKSFNSQDGFGLRILQDAGVEVGVITARKSHIVERRGRELGMRYVYQGSSDKLAAFRDISEQSHLKPFEIAYMGDDWLDLVLLNRVGFAISPANGVDEVKQVAHFITQKSGGAGAVREVCDLILHAKGLHSTILQKYQNRTG